MSLVVHHPRDILWLSFPFDIHDEVTVYTDFNLEMEAMSGLYRLEIWSYIIILMRVI